VYIGFSHSGDLESRLLVGLHVRKDHSSDAFLANSVHTPLAIQQLQCLANEVHDQLESLERHCVADALFLCGSRAFCV